MHVRARRPAVRAHEYEIVLVNDGSPDGSLALAIAVTCPDPHVIVVPRTRDDNLVPVGDRGFKQWARR